MRKSAPFVAALVAAGSVTGTATATVGPTAAAMLVSAAPSRASHAGNSHGPMIAVRCWLTWQSVRDAILHRTSPAGCGRAHRFGDR